MAQIVLSDYECEQGLLPDLCMFCGAPATRDVLRKFSWHPKWVWILVLASWLIALILAMVLTKRMTVRVPTCSEHEGVWRRRMWIVLGSFLGLAAFGVVAAVAVEHLNQQNNDLGGWICGGSGLLFVAWLIFVLVLSEQGVRPKVITKYEITLVGVSEEFAAALKEERRRDRAGELDYRTDRGRRPVRTQEEEDYDDRDYRD